MCFDSICRGIKEREANYRDHRDALMETTGIDIDKAVPPPQKPAPPPEPEKPEPPYSDLDELDEQHDAGVYRDPFSGELHTELMN
jgi:hypothetical protein